MANETTIVTNVQVSGLDKLKEAGTAMERLYKAANGHVSGGFADSMNSDLNKALSSAQKLSEMLRKTDVGNDGAGMSKMQESLTRSVSAAEKLNEALRNTREAENSRVTSQQQSMSAQQRAAESQIKALNAQSRVGSSGSSAVTNSDRIASSASKAESSWSKIKGSIKDSLSMFSVGMLGASAINGATNAVKSAFSSGFENIQQRQQGQAMWATSIEDAHRGVTGKDLQKQSAAANAAMMSTALKAGNDFSEANSMAKQIYSSDAGSYSGNLAKTNSVVKGMFNIQDANALTQADMERFKTAVGNIGDTGKMSGTIAKSLNLLDGKITRNMRAEYQRETGHALGKNKAGNWDYGQMSAATAYAGLDRYGNSGGIGHASERYNSTLGGMIRAGKSAISTGMGQFEQSFVENVNKSFGGQKGIIGKLAGFFTNSGKITGIANGAAKNVSILADKIGMLGRGAVQVAKDVAPFAKAGGKGFAKGFTSEMKGIISAVKKDYDDVKGVGKKLSGIVTKSDLSNLGQAAGKITAAVVAFRGFGKLPGMNKVLNTIFKQPLALMGTKIGGFVSKLAGLNAPQQTAAAKMNSAGDKMLTAAAKMNGENPGSGSGSGLDQALGLGGAGVKNKDGRLVDEVYQEGSTTREDLKLANSRSGRMIAEGENILGTGRVGRNASWLTKLKGNSLVKMGTLGEKVGDSWLGRTASGLTDGIKGISEGASAAGKFISKGMPLMNAAFAGLDVLNTMNSTKAGSLARHQGVGGDVGGGVGATLGGALGSLLGPLGTVGGGMAGQWLGNKVGTWIGGKFGGSTNKRRPSNKRLASDYAAEAQQKVSVDRQAANAVQAGGAANLVQAKAQTEAITQAMGLRSKSAQLASARAQDAYNNGDMKTYQKQAAVAAKETAKYYQQSAESAKSKAARDKAAYQASKKDTKAAASRVMSNGYGQSAYTSALKAEEKARSKAKKSAEDEAKATKSAAKAEADSAKVATKAANQQAKAHAKSRTRSKAKPDTKVQKAQDKINQATSRGTKIAKANGNAFETANKKAKNSGSKVESTQRKINQATSRGTKMTKANGNAFDLLAKKSKKAANASTKAAKSQSKAASTTTKAAKSQSKAINGTGKALDSAAKKSKKFSTSFKGVSKSSKTEMNKVARNVSSGLKKATSKAKSGSKAISNAIKSGLSKAASDVKSQMNKANSAMKSAFSKMVSAAKSATSKIAASFTKIGTAATAAASKVKTLASAISKLKSKTITITANVKGKGSSKLATGTPGAAGLADHLAGGWANNGGAKGGSYIVNDGKGTHWREAFLKRNGVFGVFPAIRDYRAHLDEGDQVFSGSDAHRMEPRLATGTPGAKRPKRGGNMTFNITVNVSGGSSDGNMNKMGQDIGNAIGERLTMILGKMEV